MVLVDYRKKYVGNYVQLEDTQNQYHEENGENIKEDLINLLRWFRN